MFNPADPRTYPERLSIRTGVYNEYIKNHTYEAYAQEYLRSLPPEHFMEAIPQARQREITLESLALVKARRPDFHVFNELLVQYKGTVKKDEMKLTAELPDGGNTIQWTAKRQ